MRWKTIDALTPAARLKRRVDTWAVRLRVMPRVVRIQSMTRKWGSCSTAGTVSLAVDLDDQDRRFQDYVIVHELLHLKVPSHGRLFKALMSAHVPGWRRYDRRRHHMRRVETLRRALIEGEDSGDAGRLDMAAIQRKGRRQSGRKS